jgi:hypothetical protein
MSKHFYGIQEIIDGGSVMPDELIYSKSKQIKVVCNGQFMNAQGDALFFYCEENSLTFFSVGIDDDFEIVIFSN